MNAIQYQRLYRALLAAENGHGFPFLKSDQYHTPPYAVRPLLPYLRKDATIWECAIGAGYLLRFLREEGYKVVGRPQDNFLTVRPPHYDVLVTNPPYSAKAEFVARAYSLGRPFAFLLPDYDLAQSCMPFFRRYGVQLLIPSKRIQYERINGEPTGKANFNTAWYCWRLLPKDLMFAE